jgi:hypothetical protein
LKNLYNITFITLAIFISCQNLSAQVSDSLSYFYGQVISYPEENPVAFAHVINYTQKWGVTADTSGYFEIWGTPGDTIYISAIGFQYNDKVVLPLYTDTKIVFKLQHKIYEIPEASISYFGPYQQFEQKVLHLDLPKIKFNEQVAVLFKHVERGPLVVKPHVTSPASLIYSLFSKDAKDIRKYLELKEEGIVKQEVWKKFNEHIVRNLTGLSLAESKAFIEYCNFTDQYVIKTPNYTLYSRILEKLEQYKKTDQDSLLIK